VLIVLAAGWIEKGRGISGSKKQQKLQSNKRNEEEN
jgi:hypothetical protein